MPLMRVPAPILLAVLLLAACSPARTLEAWRVLGDIAAGPRPSSLKEATPAPGRALIGYRVDGRAYTGDLYSPGAAPRSALVLVPGAAEAGKDDPRLVAFATTLARAGFAVLVPEIPNLRRLHVEPDDARRIADAVRHLAGRGLPGTSSGVGLVAISYAAGPAVLAALAPEAREKVRFLVAVGGYYDLEAVVAFFTTGYFRERPDRDWRRATPNAYGKWVFVRNNAARIEDPRDRVLLAAIAERKLRNLDAPIDDLAAGLGPEGRAVEALLENRDPEAVPGLIARLPEAIRRDMAALDLKRRDLAPIAAEVILVHGRDDAIIPYTESLKLAAALPPDRVCLVVVDDMAHVKLGPGGLLDGLRLLGAIYRILTIRDRG